MQNILRKEIYKIRYDRLWNNEDNKSNYSTVTDFAKLRGISTFNPFCTAMW